MFVVVNAGEAFTRIKTKLFYATDAKPSFVPHQYTIGSHHSDLKEGDGVVVKCSWPTKAKRAVEPNLYEACSGEFGTPSHLLSYEASYEKDFVMSNSIFLPHESRPGDIWKVWDLQPQIPQSPPAPDFRSLWVTVVQDEGVRLECCENAWDLCESVLHSMLGE